jgi:hypothetical protein
MDRKQIPVQRAREFFGDRLDAVLHMPSRPRRCVVAVPLSKFGVWSSLPVERSWLRAIRRFPWVTGLGPGRESWAESRAGDETA